MDTTTLRPTSTHDQGQQKRPKSFGYRFKVAMREPTTIIGVLAVVLFLYLILVPILMMLSDGFRVGFSDRTRLRASTGDFTLYYLQRVFGSSVSADLFWHPLLNTLMVSVGAIILALALGGTLGWLLARTDLWGRKWFATALIVPYMLPSWTFALAWMTLFRNRKVGGQLGWLEALGFNPPDWLAYGALPIIVVLALHYAPFVILLFGNALRSFDSQLEDSARILGAKRTDVTWRVVLPLMRPSLMSATILVFAKCLGDFGVAYVLGVPDRFHVLATALYQNITSRQVGTAAILAGVIVLIGVVSLLVDTRMAREAKRFVTMGSKGAMSRVNRLGAWRLPATVYAGLAFVLSVGVPLLVLFLSTVMRRPADFSPSNFTADFWIGSGLDTVALRQGILLTPEFWSAAWNTLWIVGTSAVIAGILGILVGYVVVRTPVKAVADTLRFITFLPYLVPGIAFAVAILSLFAEPRGPIPSLYGTPYILLIALVVSQMPFSSRAGISAMMQLGKDPEEAAQIAGAGWWKRMVTIVAPIQKGTLTSGILMPFISGVKGLSLVVVLAVPGTDLLTTYSMRLVDFGYNQAANAVVLMICALAFFGTLLGQKISKSSLAEGMGG